MHKNKIIKAYKILSEIKIRFENRQGFFCNDLMSKTLPSHYRNQSSIYLVIDL